MIPNFNEMGEAIKVADPSMAEVVDEVTRGYDELGELMWTFPIPRCDVCGEPWPVFVRFGFDSSSESYCRNHAPPKDANNP